jgi:mannan endo-1,4-beta-mannosidase
MQFYTNTTVITYFKNYIQYLLTHINPYTGLSYAEDPTIIGYETGNELNGLKWGDKDVPVEWIREICSFVKKLGNSLPSHLLISHTKKITRTKETLHRRHLRSKQHALRRRRNRRL